MAALPWIGLLVFLVAIAGGIAVAAVQALRAWRTLRSVQRRLERAGADVMRLLDGIEPRIERAGDTAASLEDARARLQQSLATAGVLFSALGEGRALIRRINIFVPR